MDLKPCVCGSGEISWWENDALARVCRKCRAIAIKAYQIEILINKQYNKGS
jgi:hypothetical protein